MDEKEIQLLRQSFAAARRARERGDQPFGAVLADEHGQVLLEGENTIITTRDCSGHAELNVLREASRRFDRELLARCTLYASTEPCAMCAAATVWSGVRRVVFGLSGERLYDELVSEEAAAERSLRVPSREIFVRGRPFVEGMGPVLEDEAVEVHHGYW